MSNSSVTYSIVDVFTRERYSGNPVAVIHDASTLNTAQMQNIAREFGFSETTFILPPREARHHAHVRIFTPLEEIPFAGHPNIGTVFVMGSEMTAAGAELPDMAVLDEAGGDVRVRPLRNGGDVVGAEIEAPQPLQTLGDVPSDLMARCLGVPQEALALGRLRPCAASVGLPFAFVELRDLDALTAIAPDIASFREAAHRGPETVDGFAVCAFVVLNEADGRMTIRSRVLSPLGHPPEDPATGSASGALAALLLRASNWQRGTFDIMQGVEMGRPSKIQVHVSADGGPICIRGFCVQVSEGAIRV